MQKRIIIICLILLLGTSCAEHFAPKPRGYFRIDLPEKKYVVYDSLCPFSFEYPAYAAINKDADKGAEPCWLNMNITRLNAKIHLSYKSIQKNVGNFTEDAHTLAYKHTIKADAINEKVFENTEKKVYGILYEITGNAASSVQFYVTDSTRHFLRGSLYFNAHPNKDSLAPLVDFIKKDIVHMIETFKWKD